MTVRLDAAGGVSFEVESLSRGSAGLLGRLAFPLIAQAQMRFFTEQVVCMQALMGAAGSVAAH